MQKNPRTSTKKTFKLSELSDEELEKIMNEINDEIEEDIDFSSDDEDIDPEFVIDQITPEDDQCLSMYLRKMNEGETSHAFIQDVNFSFDVSFNVSEPSTTPITVTPNSNSGKKTSKPAKHVRAALPMVEPGFPIERPSNGGFTGLSLSNISKNSKEFTNIIWRKKHMKLHVNEVAFRGNTDLPTSIMNLKTPMEIFMYFFSEETVQLIVEETNRAALNEDINSRFKVKAEEIYQYIGTLLFMSLYRYPNVESYWGRHAFPCIQNCMSRAKFMQIKKYICFADQTKKIQKGQVGYDPLFRIRKLAKELNKKFDSIPKNACLCIDEQMCSTKIKHHLRQYLPNKPHKWGIKLFVLCDTYGYAYRFEIYNGAGDNVVLHGCPDLGATANVVVRLSQTVPDFKNHIIYFDNFYTSLPLLVYLRARGIFSLGTVRLNRIPNCKLPTEKDIAKQQRGYSTEFVGSAYGIDMNVVLWKDNKLVRLMSTYVGVERFAKANSNFQTAKVTRYDRKKKEYLQIDSPQIIQEYNSHMGGVDHMDGLMGRYHLRTKTRDPFMRLFYHFVDLAATNAYILYRRMQQQKRTENEAAEDEVILKLPNFRENIAEGLVSYKNMRYRSRQSTPISGRSSRPNTPFSGKFFRHGTPQSSRQSTFQARENLINSTSRGTTSKIGTKAKHPVADIRFDHFDHFPIWMEKSNGKKKCKHCKTSQTQCMGQKCNIHLCCSNSKNCFYEYHQSK